MTQTAEYIEQKQEEESKQNPIGWGAIMAVGAVIGAVVAAVIGFSGEPLPDISQDSIDNLAAVTRGQNTGEQITEKINQKAQDFAFDALDTLDGIAANTDKALREFSGSGEFSGQGLDELSKTLFGVATNEESRAAISNAFIPLQDEIINSSQEIQEFAASGEKIARYGEDLLVRATNNEVFLIDKSEFIKLDPRITGGKLEIDKLFNGQNAEALTTAQESINNLNKDNNFGEFALKGAAVGTGVTATVVGLNHIDNLKQPERYTPRNNIVNYSRYNSAAPRIDVLGAESVRLAGQAKMLNSSFARHSS